MKSVQRSPFVVFRTIDRWRPALAIVCVVSLLVAGCATTNVPSDVKLSCTDVTQGGQAMATWFESGAITLNGVVKPADSVNFPDQPNCTFYQWSEQMYLWLTSPAPPRYGGGGRIFNSPAFFDVSPVDTNGERVFIPHVDGILRDVSVRFAPSGANNLPLFMAKSGKMFELEPTPTGPTGKQLIRNDNGNAVEIERIVMNDERQPVFVDVSGRAIQRPRPVIQAKVRQESVAQKFDVERIPIFLDFLGARIDVEQGQAGGNPVLQARNGSLVYYTTVVNDVFAYFLTGMKNGGITPTPTKFPTTQADLNKVISFATANGRTLIDPEALAIEVKMSWVETTGLPDPNAYIRTTAIIPTYDTTNPAKWVKTGEKTANLAMVGIHVVGSTKGHPEMIWATFEHVSNMPNGTYSYRRSNSTTKTVTQSTAGNWLFSANGSAGPFNREHMFFNPPDIDANTSGGFTITPSDTIRWKSWGSATNAAPNPFVGAIDSNTEILSINKTVRDKLNAADVRRNYIMTGATWTALGAAPTGSFSQGGNEVGTSLLANGTMETYQQGTSALASTGSNCFSCHVTNTVHVDDSQPQVSHVFGALQPLF